MHTIRRFISAPMASLAGAALLPGGRSTARAVRADAAAAMAAKPAASSARKPAEAEAQKPAPDAEVVKERAQVHHHVKQAEAENAAAAKAAGVKEPTEPE